jgi:hypothetical protein
MLVRDLVRVEGLLSVTFTIFFESELGEISEVVAFPVNQGQLLALGSKFKCRVIRRNSHFGIEYRFLAYSGRWEKLSIKQIDNVLADFSQFLLNLLSLATSEVHLLPHAGRRLVLHLLKLLNAVQNAPAISKRICQILVRNREKIAFINGQLRSIVVDDELDLSDNI